MADFSVGGKRYKSGKLDVFKQFYVSRRLLPVIPSLVPIMQAKISGEEVPMSEAIAIGASALAKLNDDDCTFIINTCLAVTQREQVGSTTANILWSFVASSGGLQFEDITLPQLLEITWNVLLDNFSNFFPEPPLKSPDAQAKE